MVIKNKNKKTIKNKRIVSAGGIRAQESRCLPQNSPYGLYGLKATLNSKIRSTELTCSVKVEVAVLRSPSLIVFIRSLWT